MNLIMKLMKRLLPLVLLMSLFLTGCNFGPDVPFDVNNVETSTPDDGITTVDTSELTSPDNGTKPNGGTTAVNTGDLPTLPGDATTTATPSGTAAPDDGTTTRAQSSTEKPSDDETTAHTSHSYEELAVPNALKTQATLSSPAEFYRSCACGVVNKNGGSFTYGSPINLRYYVTDQKFNGISVYGLDPNNPNNSILLNQFSDIYASGMKIRAYEGREVLLTAGNSNASMYDVATKEKLFSVEAASNTHSVELTPDGIIAVAASTGNTLSFYNAENSRRSASVEFTDAHGVLYDPDTGLIFAVGDNQLRAFKASLDSRGRVSVEEDENYKLLIPSGSAHDLTPVYGNTDRMWVTSGTRVYQYSVSEKKLYSQYDGSNNLYAKANVKGIGNFDDGSVLYVLPDRKNPDRTWTSQSIYYLKKTDSGFTQHIITDPDVEIYKLRVYNTNYQ